MIGGPLRPLDHREGQPPLLIVKSDDQFADHRASREGNDALISLQVRVDKNAGREELMHGAHIADRCPNVLRGLQSLFPCGWKPYVSLLPVREFNRSVYYESKSTQRFLFWKENNPFSFVLSCRGNTPVQVGRLRRPYIIVHVLCFACASAHAKHKTCTKGRVAATPQRVRAYCPHGFKSRDTLSPDSVPRITARGLPPLATPL